MLEKNMLEMCFDLHQAKEILRIPLGLEEEKDDVYWKATNDGNFSVKTAYRLAMECAKQMKGMAECGSSRTGDGSWKLIWNGKAAPKVKHHNWRMCRDSLPICVNLIKRGLDVDPMCPRCGESYETTTHLVLDCNVFSQAWKLSLFRYDTAARDEQDAGAWCLNMLTQLNTEEKEMFMTIVWAIWQGRNLWVFEHKWQDPMDVINKATLFHSAYRNAQEEITSAESQTATSCTHWTPPARSTLKLNTDASVTLEGEGGMGAVLRDEYGQVVMSGYEFKEKAWAVDEMEAEAIRWALKLTKEHHRGKLIVETDSQKLAWAFEA